MSKNFWKCSEYFQRHPIELTQPCILQFPFKNWSVKPFAVEYSQRDMRQYNIHHKFLKNEPWYQVVLEIMANLSNILDKLNPWRANLLGYYQTLCFHTKHLMFTYTNFISNKHKILILQQFLNPALVVHKCVKGLHQTKSKIDKYSQTSLRAAAL